MSHRKLVNNLSNSEQLFKKVSYFKVTPQQEGQRIDNYLLKTYKTIPKSKIYKILRKGEVRVNKGRVKPEYKLKLEDTIRIPPMKFEESNKEPVFIPNSMIETIKASILFENEFFLIINKPHGLAVHAGSGLSYGAVDVLKKFRPNEMVELVHRLDRDTSGCLMFAKSRKALVMLQNMLKQHEIKKTYAALVHGKWPKNKLKLDFPLKKFLMKNGEKRVRVDKEGQQALTEVIAIKQYTGFSLLNLRLQTGRTHQIRVHCQSLGHPIINDDKYGNRDTDKALKKQGFNRMMLHAHVLNISANDLCGAVEIIAPLPKLFKQQ